MKNIKIILAVLAVLWSYALISKLLFSGISNLMQIFLLMAACSFVAALILCSFDSIPWRQFRIFGSADDEDDSTSSSDQGLRRWQKVLCIVLMAPLAVIILPVALGAVPAMILYVTLARYRWIRRALIRLLRRRGVTLSWLLAFLVAPFILVRRLSRHIRFRPDAA
jgi:hypothetical protein